MFQSAIFSPQGASVTVTTVCRVNLFGASAPRVCIYTPGDDRRRHVKTANLYRLWTTDQRSGDAIRRHETDILSGLQSNLEGYLTEEARQLRASETVASFNEAQARWDAYREHMVGHGFLEPHAKTAKMPA